MSALRQRVNDWRERPATVKSIAAMSIAGAVVTAAIVSALGQWWFSGQNAENRAEDRARVDRIGDRLVRVERQDPGLCRRSPACRAAVRRESQPPAPPAPGREPRRERETSDGPDQRADRPPRTPAQPPSTPSPTPGGGGDDPPAPPQTATPVTPPSSPSTPQTPAAPKPVLEVDLPPVDLDGDRGLLPQLLPDVNLPPVDVPPLRVPGLR